MDSMMFWPHGYGPLPPAARAELEKKTAELALQSHESLRKMLELELEKGKKAEPQKSASIPPPPSPPLDGSKQDRSIQVRRADSISKQQNNLMLKAARRSVILPSLSIAIPPSPSEEQRQRSRGKRVETEVGRESEQGGDQTTVADAEPLHKQVKFLAPDDGEMSDQSSICQSPSWEGYGQRKKEKKKEAERRKKEKEQAEKDAKAAKKRQATRLSKSPPPTVNGRASRAGILSNADRSLSDPMLISQHLLPENQSSGRLDDIGRAASADDLQRFRDQQPAMAEVLSDSETGNRRIAGGVKLERERQTTLQNHFAARGQQSPSFPSHSVGYDGAYHQNPHSPPLDGSMAYAGHPTSQSTTNRQESRQSREAFPPSASRTPMLRHMPPPPALSRNNSFLQGASKIFRARDGRSSTESESDRGRHRDGYVQRHREQSTERSVAEMVYEQLVNNGSYHSASTRSSSRDTRHTRRSSFTQEAKSVAMKLAGIRLTPSAKDESIHIHSGRASSQTDYFNHSTEHSHSNNDSAAPVPFENGTSSATNQESYRDCLAEEQLAASQAALSRGALAHYDGAERPPTSRSSVSSGSQSIGGTAPRDHGKRGRSFRDVAKAALGSSKGPHPTPEGPQSQMLAVPYASLRSHVDSRDAAPEAIPVPMRSPKSIPPTTTVLQEQSTPVDQSVSSQLVSSVIKPTEVDHVGSRVSEGSSSSSAYEDGSPPPSPVTTPDTSRPQSSKDVPYTVAELPKGPEGPPHDQNDDMTLRASEGSNGSSTSTTPRQVNSESIENTDLPNEDRFSRTALPLELPLDNDCDAQSFTTSFSNLDNIDNIDETLASAAAAAKQSRQKGREDSQPVQQVKRLRSLSDTNYRSGNLDSVILPASFTQFDVGVPTEQQISIPPRSKRREAVCRPSTSHGETLSAERRQEHSPDIRHQQLEPEWGSVKKGKGSVRETADFDKSAEWAMLSNAETAEVPAKDTSFLISRSSTPEMVDPPQLSPTYPPQHKEQIDSHGPTKTQYVETRASSRTSASPPSPQSPKFSRSNSPVVKHAQRAPAPPRMASAPTPVSRPSSAASSSRSAPSMATRPTGATPVSILKQPARSTSDPETASSSASTRPPVLSALPKHMQLQAGMASRPPAAPEARLAPIAKMFVECCNCKFYHDMPSKLYECMAKPDAVVEDKLLGISGAITTMVKCPWCQHNMSTSCCAGYAAVVYLKEKLH